MTSSVENFGLLVKAAEKYADAVRSRNQLRIREAEAALHEAAMQFAAWDK